MRRKRKKRRRDMETKRRSESIFHYVSSSLRLFVSPPKTRKICFVTGTRAEFGLMRTVLNAIRKNPKLKLQIVVTGMHLHDEHGRSLDTIRDEGWKIDAVVAWKNQSDPSHLAAQT